MSPRVLLVVVAFALAGCEKTWRNMYDDARVKPLQPSSRFADGRSARPPVPGTVDRSQAFELEDAQANPVRITPALLERGHERFAIYCEPCHGASGDGDGHVVKRGFPAPPSYRLERLRGAGDRHFYDVMTQGYGVMYPYGDRITPADRWAIVAWIRALQADAR